MEVSLVYYRLMCGYAACVLGILAVFPLLREKRVRKAAFALFVEAVVLLLLLVFPMSMPPMKPH
jgi:hypothetical protein